MGKYKTHKLVDYFEMQNGYSAHVIVEEIVPEVITEIVFKMQSLKKIPKYIVDQLYDEYNMYKCNLIPLENHHKLRVVTDAFFSEYDIVVNVLNEDVEGWIIKIKDKLGTIE